jgi:ribosome-associated protein
VPELLQVTGDCAIDVGELAWRFTPSGGPGGQHANRSATRAEVSFDVAASPSLSEWQRRRLLDRLGPVVVVAADDERSQYRNRRLARDRLRQRLADALHVEPPRRATRPSRGSVERRLHTKRQRATIKKWRQQREE